MKKIIAVLSLLMVVGMLSAATYYVGAEGGATLNTVIAGKGYRNYEYAPAFGYKVAVPVVVNFSDNLGLETGISVYAKNYRYFQDVDISIVSTQRNFDLDTHNGYVTLPLLFRATLPVGQFDVYASVGGYVGYWMYARKTGFVVNGNDQEEKVDETTQLSLYNQIDAGLSARIGGGINFGSFNGYVQAEYDFSLTSMNKGQKHGAYTTHNSTFCVTLGLLWGINK